MNENNQNQKRVAVIVVLWKSRRFLDTWFEAMAKIDYPRQDIEIVMYDNASSDGSQEYVEEMMASPLPGMPKIHYIRGEENIGFAGGNNRAFEYALGKGFDYVYLLNYDTRPDPGFIKEAVEAGESNEKIGAVQSMLLLWPEKDLINSSGNMIHYLGFGFCGNARVPFKEEGYIGYPEIASPSGAGVLIKSSVLREVGFFDEKLFAYHEDLDLGWNIWLAGYANVLAPKSIIYHEYEFSRSIKKYYWMERNRYIVYFANYKLLTQLLFLPACLIMELGQFVFSIKSGWWKEKLKVYAWIFAPWNWPYMISKHLGVMKIRKVKDRDIIKYFVGSIRYQEIDNWALRLANPFFNLYFLIIRAIIFW